MISNVISNREDKEIQKKPERNSIAVKKKKKKKKKERKKERKKVAARRGKPTQIKK
ncbi:hypothetical protein ACSAZK_14890 [Methanosarcina sp. Mfa9]|uniref:hypothetical protein n=1 Tax=Methanosarcina sp. Mfa9 TaxID=3439063 RepID=UPI003F8272C7